MKRNRNPPDTPDLGEAFPPVSEADEHGLLAIGGTLEPELVLAAYRRGIFPWPMLGDEGAVTWFAPPMRAIIALDEFVISRSLKKEQKRAGLTFALDRDFRSVIEACRHSDNRKVGFGTWITPAMVETYCELHEQGWAHAIGCYENDQLVGGLYGISIGGMFAGESMFYHRANASKLSLCFLVEQLRQRGARWIDCQQLTPLFESFGAKEISREEFQTLLRQSLQEPALFDPSSHGSEAK